jgi:hypothetical protein
MSVSSLCMHLRVSVLLPARPDTDGLPGTGSLALSFPRNVTVKCSEARHRF